MSDPLQANNGNLLVVAGAGTGKTYNLVQACVARLKDPQANLSIDEVLIVTFTKAAAAELRRRIGEALQTAFQAEPNSPHLARQIALLDRAQISTLHSFCLELVSRHFSDLGLSPRLTTLEAAQAVMVETEAIEALFERYYEADTAAAKAARRLLMEWFKGDDRAARKMVRSFHSFTQTRPNPARWFAQQRAALTSLDPIRWRQWHAHAVDEWVNRWRPLVEEQSDEKNPARAQALAFIDRGRLADVAALFDAGDETWPRGTKKRFRDPLKAMYEEASELSGWMKTDTSDPLLEDWELTRETSITLLNMAEDFASEFARLKRERGLVDFHDLEQFSLQLLWNDDLTKPSAAAEYWRERFKWIFVDEYQDINQAQDKIIEALARPAERGNRFLVGDVKQSIYGFRQADPEIFEAYHKLWTKGQGGACQYLTRNWRSHESILDFVNGLFESIMPGYDENARLQFADHPDRTNFSAKVDPAPKVEVHMVQPAENADDPDNTEPNVLQDLEKAEAEAEVIAELCGGIVKNGASYGDIVILMRSAASEVEAFAKVFSRRGIPFDARRTGFFNCIEVLDLLNLLTILDNPLQDIPLLGVLRSPLGCFSLEELAQIRMVQSKGSFWDALQHFKNPKAKDFLARFKKWRELARHTSLAQRLEIILEESSYEDWVTAQDRGAQRRANVRRLVELARQFDTAHGEGLYPFLQYVEEQTKAVGDIAPASVESHGAVRLMTVHQSKGLQFPVVIMAGLNKGFNRQDFRGLSLLDDEFGPCIKARPPGKRRQYETLPFWMARHRQEKKLLEEEMRILYVALTRAERRLILVGSPSKKMPEQWRNGGKRIDSAKSMLDWIGPWLTRNCPEWLDQAGGEAKDWIYSWRQPSLAQSISPLEGATDKLSAETLATLKTRLEWSYPFKPATRQEAKSSATALRRALPDEPELARPLLKNPRHRRDSMTANELGQAAHRFMQHARFEAFAKATSIHAEVIRLREAGILQPEEADAIDTQKILGFWQSEFGRELLSRADAIERELAFTAKFSEADLHAIGAPIQNNFGAEEFIVVQGAVDLVAILDGELWLVDFKTDRLPTELLGARIQEYSLQIRIYALALSRIYRRPVTRACLHFLEAGRTEAIEL